MRVLVTAGPTREAIDDVRFISNPSSGRMGFACASAAASRGHDVVLVTGPVELPDPAGVKVVRVVTAQEMHKAAMAAYRRADAVIATAAVCDYRPLRRAKGKIKKGARRAVLELVRTPDILGEMGARKGGRVLIGFALEVQRARPNALEKLRRKNLDAVVLNSPKSFRGDVIAAEIITPQGSLRRKGTKRELALTLIRLIESR